MERTDVERLLESTLEDRRLSRGERHAIKATIAELELSEDDRRFWRNCAFALAEERI